MSDGSPPGGPSPVSPPAGARATTIATSEAFPVVAYSAAALTLVFWSGTAIANRFVIAHIDALSAGIGRSMIAGFAALAIALVLRLPFPQSPRHRWLLLYSGWTNFAIWPALLSLGVALANASHAALIMTLLPVFTSLFAATLSRRLPRPGWWLGAGIALVGTALLVGFTRPQGDLVMNASFLLGDFLLLAGVAVCASGYVAGARLSPVIGTWGSTFWGLSAALLVLVPAMFFVGGGTDWSAVPLSGWAAIGWLAFLSSLAGYALWFLALERGGITRIASWQFAQPVLTVTAAALLLDEPMTWQVAAAGLAIVGGTVIAHRHAK